MPRRHLARRDEQAPKIPLASAIRAIGSRKFWVITVANLLVMTSYYLVFVITAAHVRETWHTSLSVAGLAVGVMVLGCLVGRFVSGNLVSLLGCKKILWTGLVLYVASLAAQLAPLPLGAFFSLRFLVGAGAGITCTATGTIVALVVPREYQGLGVSIFSMGTALALALGPFLGIGIGMLVGYETAMAATLALSIAAMLLSLLTGPLPRALHHHRPILALGSYVDMRVVPFACVAFLTCLGYGCVQTFLTSLASERDLAAPASLYFLAYGIATIFSRPLTGRIFDRHGENVLLVPILCLTAIALYLLA